MKSKVTQLAAAAIIIVGVFVGINMFKGTPAYAVEQTIEALWNIHTLRMETKDVLQSAELLMKINPETGLTDHIRMNKPSTGDIVITIPGQSYMYEKQRNEIQLVGQELLRNDLNFKDPINSLTEQTNASGGRLVIAKEFSETAQRDMIRVTIIRQDESVAGEFLMDPDTKLPIYIGVGAQDGKLNYMGPIEYNVEIPEDTFEFTVYENVTVIDNRPDALKSQ